MTRDPGSAASSGRATKALYAVNTTVLTAIPSARTPIADQCERPVPPERPGAVLQVLAQCLKQHDRVNPGSLWSGYDGHAPEVPLSSRVEVALELARTAQRPLAGDWVELVRLATIWASLEHVRLKAQPPRAPTGFHRRTRAAVAAAGARRLREDAQVRHGETRCTRAGACEREPARMPARRT